MIALGETALGDLIGAEVTGIAVFAGLRLAGAPPLTAAGGAAVFALLLVGRIGRRSLLDWARTGWRYRRPGDHRVGPTVDFRVPGAHGDRAIGLHWSADRVVAVIELTVPHGGSSTLRPTARHDTHPLPLGALARALIQHDIVLNGLDIVTHGHRCRTGTTEGDVYEELIGPLPAAAVGTVWLAVGLRPADCPAAVARRGGGREGSSRAVTVAAHRIVRLLAEHGCPARLLTAAEIRTAVLRVTAGTDPRRIEQRWQHAVLTDRIVATGGAFHPDALSSELLAAPWTTPSAGTTTVLRLRRGRCADTVRIGAGWRLIGSTGDRMPAAPRLPRRSTVATHGRHRSGLLSHLPIAPAESSADLPTGEYPIADVDRLRVSAGGCGQLIGADRDGHAVAARVIGAGGGLVRIAGEVELAHQVVFRAVAIGARILIRTDRPQAWAPLVDAIGNPDRLALADAELHSTAGYTALVVDGPPAPEPTAAMTVIRLGDPTDRFSGRQDRERTDLLIRQSGGRDRVVLEGGGHRIELTVVSTEREAAFLRR